MNQEISPLRRPIDQQLAELRSGQVLDVSYINEQGIGIRRVAEPKSVRSGRVSIVGFPIVSSDEGKSMMVAAALGV